jgi:hypothetical protein
MCGARRPEDDEEWACKLRFPQNQLYVIRRLQYFYNILPAFEANTTIMGVSQAFKRSGLVVRPLIMVLQLVHTAIG